jgi:hypothetical protein
MRATSNRSGRTIRKKIGHPTETISKLPKRAPSQLNSSLGWHISKAITLKRMGFCVLLAQVSGREFLRARASESSSNSEHRRENDEIEALEQNVAIAVKKQ